ncbi:MAG: tetraacyldisaccharide 4'-kinase [Vicingaceae bacterium]
MFILRLLLLPFSILYAIGVLIREFIFFFGLIMEQDCGIPTLAVGNISAGGTGKTPFTETLIKLFGQTFSIAIASRGYGRTTTGFHWVELDSPAWQVGDEMLQLKRKYPNLPMAVCESRLEAAKRIREEYRVNLLLLDDAFQHRQIVRRVNILLTTYKKPYFNDYLLPMGSLREFRWAKHRADIIVLTKCPPDSTRKSVAKYLRRIRPSNRQFATYAISVYDEAKSLFEDEVNDLSTFSQFILVTGIASNKDLLNHVSAKGKPVKVMRYRDHARYSKHRVKNIANKWRELNGHTTTCIITTPKDAVKLREKSDLLKGIPVFYIDYSLEMPEWHQFRNRIVPRILS